MPSPATLLSQNLHPVLARRSSYTSLVYKEKDDYQPGGGCSVHKLAQCLVEWLVVLQGVAEERELDVPAVNCRCNKAVKINDELKSLNRKMGDAWQVVERVGQVQLSQLEEIQEDIKRIAAALRADVSILVPSSIGRADLAIVEQAQTLMADGDLKLVVSESVDGIAKLVYNLLGVENCRHCTSRENSQIQPMEEIDADIMSMVAAMCSSGDNVSENKVLSNKASDKSVGLEVLEKSRKRKQNRPSKISSPITTTSSNNISGSPLKKMKKFEPPNATRTEILVLLEKKKKLVKKDGLYKFVLWREALKDEKTKLIN